MMTKSLRLLERAKKSAALSLTMASAAQTSAKSGKKVTKKRAKKKTRVKAADKRRCVPHSGPTTFPAKSLASGGNTLRGRPY